ncbi:choice-of-anchor B family protein [bacterium AH-315-J21]|nr:choice-of-anchor B family protein [bacterium AH-315-J21]
MASALALILSATLCSVSLAEEEELFIVPDYNLNLLANRPVTSGVAKDIWGWTNPVDGKEYVLLCVGSGLEIYDIATPTNPILVATVNALGSDLKDVKTFQRYAYAAEQGGPIQIIDLGFLPDSAITVGAFTAPDITGSHNIYIDTLTGFAYLAMNGAGRRDIRILDLTNPISPTEVGALSQTDAFCSVGTADTHDMWCEGDTCYYASLNDGILVIDVTDKSAPTFIQMHRYSKNFTHSIWPSADRKFVFTTDEIPGGHLRIFDVQNKNQIRQVGSYQATESSIIHNAFVRDTLIFIAYYGEGVKVLNIVDPAQPVEVASYDTYPQGTGISTTGCWGVYPYFASGVIAASDIDNGLFLFTLNEVNHGWLTGTIRDQNGATVPGARISIDNTNYMTYSLADGSYRLPAPNQTDFVTVFRSGYDVFFAPVVMSQATTVIFNPTITTQAGATISGSVTVRDNNGALSVDTTVRFGVSAHFLGPIAPANDGSFSLGNLRQGTEQITAYRWGYLSANTIIEALNQPVEIALELQAGYSDDFEWDLGWRVGEQSVSRGAWERAVPFATFFLNDIVQPDSDHGSGADRYCWITGASNPGASFSQNDVSSGSTTLFSPLIDLSAYGNPHVNYWRWFSNNHGFNSGADPWVTAVSNDGGTTWVTLEDTTLAAAQWTQMDFRIRDYVQLTNQVMFKFVATEGCSNSVVEAALDDFSIYDDGSTCCRLAGDANDDGIFNIGDIVFLINRIFTGGPNGPCPDQMNANGDGTFDLADITFLIERVFRGGPPPTCP